MSSSIVDPSLSQPSAGRTVAARASSRPSGASRYRALAATVRANLLDSVSRGAEPPDPSVGRELQAMRSLLAVGRRYSPSGHLDTSRSSPEIIDLAVELPQLARDGTIASLRPHGQLDMKAWTRDADGVLARLQAGESLDPQQQAFLAEELLPLLTAWMRLPAPAIRE